MSNATKLSYQRIKFSCSLSAKYFNPDKLNVQSTGEPLNVFVFVRKNAKINKTILLFTSVKKGTEIAANKIKLRTTYILSAEFNPFFLTLSIKIVSTKATFFTWRNSNHRCFKKFTRSCGL